MKNLFWIISAFVLIISSCADPPQYPDEPVISFISLSKNELVGQTVPAIAGRDLDSLVITFGFTDGDGDIGVADTNNVFLADSRLNNNAGESFQISPIPQQGVGNGISGEVEVLIPNISCRPNVASRDTLHYRIQIVDNSGKQSNVINTPDIILICD